MSEETRCLMMKKKSAGHLSPPSFFLKPLCGDQIYLFRIAPVVTSKRLTYASARVAGAPSALPLWGVTGGLHSQRKALWSTPADDYLNITNICNTTELNPILHLCSCNYIHLGSFGLILLDPPPPPDSRFFWTTGLTVNTPAPFAPHI